MSSSSSDIYGCDDYDVFLSFRGSTRNNFTSHLYKELCSAKIKAFIDNRLRRGEEISPSLLKVIGDAKISIIVFSSDYASSTFCLDEVEKIIECREFKEQIVLPIFYKVDPSDIRKQKGEFGKAFALQEAKLKRENEMGKRRKSALCKAANLIFHKENTSETSKEGMKKVERWKWVLCKAANLTGWHLDENSNEAEYIQRIIREISKLLNWELPRGAKGEELISIPLDGLITAVANLEKIWNCLMNDNTSRVGVYGMGGVGKTTIVTHINNRLIKDVNSFDNVYWVTVSKASSVYKLQSDIAKVLKIDLSKEEDERKRASKLWHVLKTRKKFVLILDDMWESFEMEEVGIPISVDSGKILLTTRKHGLCKAMKCEQIVEMEPLSKQEAVNVFIKESGQRSNDHLELSRIVDSIVGECVGLPLAIATIARSTRKFVEIYQWRNLLLELKKPSDGQNHEMEEKVFKPLKLSYDRLSNDKHRQCLLYCSLYPEDYIIVRSDLIGYWIGEGVIEEMETRQAEFDKGNSIIDELIDASLLVNHNEDYIKMYDVVRDMALTITREHFMVKAGLQLRDFPKVTQWTTNLEYVSIMQNNWSKSCMSDLPPNCSKLRTLLMQMNRHLIELPSSFFVNMRNLTVLDMGGLSSLRLLPDSISKLENLRMLLLGECHRLEYIPYLGELANLQHLDLHGTEIRKIPKGLEKLVNLKVLNLSRNRLMYGLIPNEVLENISLLQCLKLEESYVEVDLNALIGLQKLETLSLKFKNLEMLSSYLKSGHWEKLVEYRLYYNSGISYLKKDNVLRPNLYFRACDGAMFDVLRKESFADLQMLDISNSDVTYLFRPAFAQQLLHNVKVLQIGSCDMEEIITVEDCFNQSNNSKYPTIILPKLVFLRLNNMPRLRNIYKGRMICPSLENIGIDNCNELRWLPFFMQEGEADLTMMLPSLKTIKGSRRWWLSLQWDHPNAKQALQPYFDEIEIDHFFHSELQSQSGAGRFEFLGLSDDWLPGRLDLI